MNDLTIKRAPARSFWQCGSNYSLILQGNQVFSLHKHEKCRICLVDKFGIFHGAGYRSRTFSGSNPPTANFFRLLCSVYLPQKVRGIFALKMKKTDSGAVWLTNPKPVFLKFIELSDIFAPNVWKLPDLSGRQIRQLIWKRYRVLIESGQGGAFCRGGASWTIGGTGYHEFSSR